MRNKLIIFLGIFLTGIMSVLIYPTVIFGYRLPDAGSLAWFHLVPLLVVLYLQEKNYTRFLTALLSGIIAFGGSLYWFAVAMTNYGGVALSVGIAILLLIAVILSFFYAVALTLSFWISEKINFSFSLVLTLVLTSVDFVRLFIPIGGFPWPLPAYSQGSYLLFFQWIDITGIWGLNAMIYLVNGLLAEMVWSWFGQHAVDQLIRRVLGIVLIVLISFYGSILSQRTLKAADDQQVLSVGLIQGNIHQELKWNPVKEREHFEKYLKLSAQASDQGAELVIWPETAYPYPIDLTETKKFVMEEAESSKNDFSILFGAVSEENVDGQQSVYNSAFLYEVKKPGFEGVYHKRHLVPFGEYVPMKEWLHFAHKLTTSVGDFSHGQSASPLNFKNFKLGVLICYEDIFPDLARSAVLQGADWLVNISNDAWYADSSALYQHLVFSQVRALENRRPLLRTTNTGVTALIDARGSVLKTISPFKEGHLTQTIALEKKNSLYTKYGDWMAWLCVAGTLYCLFKAMFTRKSTQF